MKSWLIKTSAPFCGTDQYYGAYSEDKDLLLDWLYENWFGQECQDLWDNYSYLDHYEDEWEELSEKDKEDFYGGDYNIFIDSKYEDWCCDCDLSVSECPEDEFDDYTPAGTHLEIVYDGRQH